METPSESLRTVSVEDGKVYCKCEDGWTCIISKVDDSEAADPFYKCGEDAICVCTAETKEGDTLEKTIQVEGGGTAICYIPKGWKCLVFKSNEAPPAKTYFECGQGCKCEIVA